MFLRLPEYYTGTDKFDRLIASGRPVIVDFTATLTAGPCKNDCTIF